MLAVSRVERLRSFYRRRISIPVDHTALVLDVGSGDKPHWRADVLLDRYIGSEHAGQRSGGETARVDRPLFDADAADMPFADQVFDYAEAASAKILDFPSHLWWVTLDEGTLVFTAKSAPYFDADIDRYLTESGIRQPLADLLDRHIAHRVIELPWRGTISCRVVGTLPADLVAAVDQSATHHRRLERVLGQLVAEVLTLPLRRRKHRGPIPYDTVVRADLRTGRGDVLDARVYRVG